MNANNEVTPSNLHQKFNDHVLQSDKINAKSQKILFPNHPAMTAMRTLYFGDLAKYQNDKNESLLKLSLRDELPPYNTNEFDSLNSHRGGQDRSISPPPGMNSMVNDKYLIRWNDKAYNTPIDLTDIQKPSNFKNLGVNDNTNLSVERLNSKIEHSNDNSVPDFYSKSIASLENFRKGL